MKETDRIKQLQDEIAQAKSRIDNCKHDYDKPKYDPETIKVGYGSIQVGRGSDPWWDFAGYEDKEQPRWSKECKHCGHKEYTYNQKPIITGTEPDFGK